MSLSAVQKRFFLNLTLEIFQGTGKTVLRSSVMALLASRYAKIFLSRVSPSFLGIENTPGLRTTKEKCFNKAGASGLRSTSSPTAPWRVVFGATAKHFAVVHENALRRALRHFGRKACEILPEFQRIAGIHDLSARG